MYTSTSIELLNQATRGLIVVSSLSTRVFLSKEFPPCFINKAQMSRSLRLSTRVSCLVIRSSEKWDFLTHHTTCASEMLEKTTCEIFCQKEPPAGGGTFGQATRGQRRHGGAAIPKSGT
jgi:hypothetical protein